MTDADGAEILDCLARVERQRSLRAVDAALHSAVLALKGFQQGRFARSYADLLASPRYAAAARFFLEELYGPNDFSRRDAQFRRIVKPLVHLFPREVVRTVLQLARLHALSEELDSAMGRHLIGVNALGAGDYTRAWCAVGSCHDRLQQIELTLNVGESLDVYTRKPMLRHALRMMRGPASAAGLHELQRFLESGFDTFRAMKGANEFLATVKLREQQWGEVLFQGDPENRLGQLLAA